MALTSVGSIINFVPATVASYWNGPSHCRGFQISRRRSLKYWFENRVGLTTHGLCKNRVSAVVFHR